jgi:hypothetical protein
MRLSSRSNRNPVRSLKRGCRLLPVAGLFALVVGLWPSPAQATITCHVQDYRYCSVYTCCAYTCVTCTDSKTGESDTQCSEVLCYDKRF